MKNEPPRVNVSGRRRFLISLASLAIGGLLFGYKGIIKKSLSKNKAHKIAPQPDAKLGINLSDISYWATEFPFVDLMHQSDNWVSQPPSGDWGKGPALVLDEHGWLKKLEKGCRATKIICASDVAYPSGTYVILYDGEGEIKLNSPNNNKIKKTKDGRLEVKVDADKGMLAIDIVSTNPQNYLRNIHVIAPGFEASYQSNSWHPDFLERWSGVACLRFMDMMATNNSSQINWIDRPELGDASYAEKGVPVELLIDLANRLEIDAWFCMPHQVNDDYIKQFATVVRDNLKPHLKVWVEYSNEVWNGGFEQYAYAAKQGKALNLASDEWVAAFHYNAKRSVEIFNIWHMVFNDRDRLVNVIASQAANTYLSEQLLRIDALVAQADVLAIAPYVSLNVPLEADEAGISASKVVNWDLDQLFEYLNRIALPESKNWIDDSKEVTDVNGMKLVAYEAGQHLVGTQGAENNDQLTSLLIKANGDARMGEIYTKYLKHWQQAGGDVMCMYNSVGGWSKWGSWGLLQHQQDTDSPKFKAVMGWAKSRGQKVND